MLIPAALDADWATTAQGQPASGMICIGKVGYGKHKAAIMIGRFFRKSRRAGSRNRRVGLAHRRAIVAVLAFCIPPLVLAGPIHDAAEAGDIDRVRQLVGAGVPVTSEDDAGNTPLHWAAFNGNTRLVRFLLDAGAAVNVTNDLYVTPLLLATFKSNWDAAGLLAARGGDPSIRDSDNATAMSIAVQWEKWGLVKDFVLHGADPNLPDEQGAPPLAHVTEDLSPAMVVWLVEHGATVNVQNRYGLTPLHRAASWGQVDTVRYLVAQGSDVNARANDSLTPLYYGILSGSIEVVRALLDAGADPDVVWNAGRSYPETPLVFAHTFHDKRFGNQVADLLLARGAKVRVVPVPCVTAGQIREINGLDASNEVAHLRGADALVYVLLDPIWSRPEFDDSAYRVEGQVAALKAQLEQIVQTGIDELIVWKLPSPYGLGAAVPFRKGCAVELYGEPDHLDKLKAMQRAAMLISRHGLDDARVRDAIREVLLADLVNERADLHAFIDLMIHKIRPYAVAREPEEERNAIPELWFQQSR